MRKSVFCGALLVLLATSAPAQLPGLRKYPSTPKGQQAVPLTGIDALRADFLARSGADTVYFGADTAVLGAPARATLAAQAQWIRQHPDVLVRVEGHGEPNDTRDHALAMGARRAEEVRDYLVLLGVPAAQLGTTSFGKEHPGPPRTVTVLVR
jgi:peptidoglycan-associated lipoprotein